MSEQLNGRVEWFNRTRGYGFAKVEGIENDVLLHQSVIQQEGFRFLKPGQEIVIEGLEDTDKGQRALKIIPVA
ncbi:cold-shock DNA-binding domain protein [Vibrio phage 1.152.O._10N.222.46.E1]|uniref:Cold-shock DNA-binding domain protein n=5 Tax=Nahantvirus 49C7 TaxID=2846601 RepID=A0A2I7RBF1_9CAUD|nr:cold shock protein [Vibrio phage 1.026.O._10N.222.49.C7]AUR82552.1 cold-shock DNA-binding domain protein [Vibrio phage 1.025.O._10N.222.46.B6]AUR90802.1 cold-shock DNA-binding domain protein [Vibrio phage 1.150.O._10N.222.46.A6]AUR90975.1 cold-shock DNA-binding domain protein [Vibrio phage 1.152.O._10N.222.46.E1]AUS02443.1 cold-shock DNA-binding domain protein [Vibrio phage 2.130.O._10N.222.46.C2]AUR82660.1 cold-shock DNA-binding domain protein [Vibrio phage 1.026.O._10N.222.49.C7]